jgi:hypothetical protein
MPHPKVKISDNSGNEVAVTDNALHVNVAGATMSTGDIEVNSEFPAAAVITDDFANPTTTSAMSMLMGYDDSGSNWNRLATGTGTTSTSVLRVTLTADDALTTLNKDFLSTIAGDTTEVAAILQQSGVAYNQIKGIVPLVVRNDVLERVHSGIADGDYSELQVDALGALYTSSVKGSLDTFAMIDVDNSEEVLSDTIGTITDCNEIIFQADESNSGYIMIGDTDVADNRGIKLNAGDTFILEKQSTAGINLWASAADQNLRCTLMRAA